MTAGPNLYTSSSESALDNKQTIIKFATLADLNTAISRGQAADWESGQEIVVSAEPYGFSRIWNGSDALTVVLPNSNTVVLASSSNTILATSGTPSGGNNGDYAWDKNYQTLYGPKSGGLWGDGFYISKTAVEKVVSNIRNIMPFGVSFDGYDLDNQKYFFDSTLWTARGSVPSGTPIYGDADYHLFGTKGLKLGNTSGGATGSFEKEVVIPVTAALTQHDLTNIDVFTFWVYCNGPVVNDGQYPLDWAAWMIAVGDTNFTNSSYGYIVTNSNTQPLRRGWNNLSMLKSEFSSVLAGSGVNWADIKRMQFRIAPKATASSWEIHIDSMFVGGELPTKKTQVCITMDDGAEDLMAQSAIFNAKGIPCHLNVMPDYVSPHNASYMTLAQLRDFYNRGNTLGFHHQDVNGFITHPEYMLSVMRWLITNGFTRDDGHLYGAYPNGTFNQSTIDAAISYGVKGIRSISGIQRNDASSIEEMPNGRQYENVLNGGIANPYKINAAPLSTSAAALALVDIAIARKAAQIFYVHGFANMSYAETVAFATGLKSRIDAGTIECLTFPKFCKMYSR